MFENYLFCNTFVTNVTIIFVKWRNIWNLSHIGINILIIVHLPCYKKLSANSNMPQKFRRKDSKIIWDGKNQNVNLSKQYSITWPYFYLLYFRLKKKINLNFFLSKHMYINVDFTKMSLHCKHFIVIEVVLKQFNRLTRTKFWNILWPYVLKIPFNFHTKFPFNFLIKFHLNLRCFPLSNLVIKHQYSPYRSLP